MSIYSANSSCSTQEQQHTRRERLEDGDLMLGAAQHWFGFSRVAVSLMNLHVQKTKQHFQMVQIFVIQILNSIIIA